MSYNQLEQHTIASSGIKRTKSLFYEYASDKDRQEGNCLYTFGRVDREYGGRTYPSLYRLYMECTDLTEYEFVSTYFFDPAQWERICNNRVLKDEVEAWRLEKKLRDTAKLVNTLKEDAEDEESKTRSSSAKYLIDNFGVKPRSPRAAGRPPSLKSQSGAKQPSDDSVARDLQRIIGGQQ